MIAILLGAPGSGKGTQAKVLQEDRGWLHLSTGDMLRAAIQNNTTLGQKAKSYMDKGELVPDAVVIGLIQEQVQSQKKVSRNVPGIILDGFPRTVEQANALKDLLGKLGQKVDKVLYFEINEDDVIRRLSGRRTCPGCGKIYHIESSPPKKEGVCDTCGGELKLRDDDRKEVIQKRLKVYDTQTSPLIEYYKKQKMLHSLDASSAPEKVNKAVQKILGI